MARCACIHNSAHVLRTSRVFRCSREVRPVTNAEGERDDYHTGELIARLQRAIRRPPPFRAQPEGRARNLGEAGSAQARRAEHCTVGATPIKCTGNRTEGSNPSLSAKIAS